MHQYASAGTYQVGLVVQDSIGCTADRSETVVIDYGVSIDPGLSETSLRVHPNPFRSSFVVTWEGYQGPGYLWLYDSQGKAVLSRQRIQAGSLVELNALAQGLYTLKVQLGGAYMIRKVIKE